MWCLGPINIQNVSIDDRQYTHVTHEITVQQYHLAGEFNVLTKKPLV